MAARNACIDLRFLCRLMPWKRTAAGVPTALNSPHEWMSATGTLQLSRDAENAVIDRTSQQLVCELPAKVFCAPKSRLHGYVCLGPNADICVEGRAIARHAMSDVRCRLGEVVFPRRQKETFARQCRLHYVEALPDIPLISVPTSNACPQLNNFCCDLFLADDLPSGL